MSGSIILHETVLLHGMDWTSEEPLIKIYVTLCQNKLVKMKWWRFCMIVWSIDAYIYEGINFNKPNDNFNLKVTD